jgi:hypothetical protein
MSVFLFLSGGHDRITHNKTWLLIDHLALMLSKIPNSKIRIANPLRLFETDGKDILTLYKKFPSNVISVCYEDIGL